MLSRLKNVQLLPGSTLAWNTGWMLIGLGLKVIVQAAYFTVIARSLGAQNYGAFVGVVGLVGIASPFGSLGSGNLLVKNVARDRTKFTKEFGTALVTTFLASSILFSLVVLFSLYLLPRTIPIRLVMLVAGSDLFGMALVTISGYAFAAFERMKWTASINVLLSLARLLGACALVTTHNTPSALSWGFFYFTGTGIAAVTALLLVFAKLGLPSLTVWRNRSELREGLYFSVGRSAETIYNDIDKTMLARLGTLEATGIYGAAYRLIDVSFAPVASLLAAAYAGFFRAGADGISSALQYAKPMVWRAFSYSAFIALTILLAAGIVPYVLGREYIQSVEALRWLAVLPVLRVVHLFLADAMSSSGHQGLRTLIQVSAAAFNVVLNLWAIPAYSWRGAAWSSIASDAFLACGMGAAVLLLSRSSQAGLSKAFEVSAKA